MPALSVISNTSENEGTALISAAAMMSSSLVQAGHIFCWVPLLFNNVKHVSRCRESVLFRLHSTSQENVSSSNLGQGESLNRSTVRDAWVVNSLHDSTHKVKLCHPYTICLCMEHKQTVQHDNSLSILEVDAPTLVLFPLPVVPSVSLDHVVLLKVSECSMVQSV